MADQDQQTNAVGNSKKLAKFLAQLEFQSKYSCASNSIIILVSGPIK